MVLVIETMTPPTTVEQLDRTVHNSTSGIEIVREFYVEPYDAHQQVQKALHGYIKEDGDDITRIPPAADPYIANCYCVESRAVLADPRVMASSPTLGDPDNPFKAAGTEKKPEPNEGLAGALVTAHYKPLITAYLNEDGTPSQSGESSMWDWLNPRVVPGVREIQWPLGLHINAKAIGFDCRSVPDDVANPLFISVDDVYVTRTMVPTIPREAIQQAEGCVNTETFPPTGEPCGSDRGGFPSCRPHTLRFIGATVKNMLDVEGKRWYEIEYHFQRISHWSRQVMNDAGEPGEDWVTWNHAFMRPIGARLGWYPVYLTFQRAPIKVTNVLKDMLPWLQLWGGRMMNECNFYGLFKLKNT